MWYEEKYLDKTIHIIRDLSTPSRCWFHVKDVATILTNLSKKGKLLEFSSPDLAFYNIMKESPNAFNGYFIRLADYDNPLDLDFYLDLNGIVLFFLLAKAPNWHFYEWARRIEEKITSKWTNFLATQTESNESGILFKIWNFLSLISKKVIKI